MRVRILTISSFVVLISSPQDTSEPIFSPMITRRMFPLVNMLNTMIGTWLFMHNEIAVVSITASCCVRTSM
jgi:hypothetical protein